MERGWSRSDTVASAALAVAALVTRGVLRGRTLYSFDSGLLASGIDSYNFSSGHPHPPYYPLTIAIGKVLAPWLGIVDALVWMAVVASAALAALTYAVGRAVGGRWVGLIAAAWVVLSPVALFNGIVALSYSLEGAASAGFAWAAWECHRRPSRRRAIVVGVVGALAVGLRPSSFLFLAPLGLWSVWGRWRAMGVALAAGTVVGLAWLVPALVAGGGVRDFMQGNGYQSDHVLFWDTVFHAGWGVVPRNLGQLQAYAPVEWSFTVAALAGAAVTFGLWRHAVERRLVAFFAAWMAPPLLFYAFIYVGWPVFPSGYVMVIVPAFAVAVAWLLHASFRSVLASHAPPVARRVVAGATALLIVAPAAWVGAWDDARAPQDQAETWEASWQGLDQVFPPNETALMTFISWHWVRIEHPDHLAWGVLPYGSPDHQTYVHVMQTHHRQDSREAYRDAVDGIDDPPHPVPPWVQKVVLVDHPGGSVQLTKDNITLHSTTLPGGRQVQWFDPAGLQWIEQAVIWFDEDGMFVVP